MKWVSVVVMVPSMGRHWLSPAGRYRVVQVVVRVVVAPVAGVLLSWLI